MNYEKEIGNLNKDATLLLKKSHYLVSFFISIYDIIIT